MCRFVAYRGPPIRLDELLYKPEHSLVHQSVHAEERDEPLNGDGWGVGWYRHDVTPEPALYRSTSPAWSDENMRLVAPAVQSRLWCAHVRDASPGLAVHQLNCHPFVGGVDAHGEADDPLLDPADDDHRWRRRLLFMHNGELGAYREVTRRLRHELPEDLYFSIRGSTDSEHAFAVIQDHLGDDPNPGTVDLVEATRSGLAYLEDLKEQVGRPEAETQANLCLTDGEAIVATRFAHPDDVPAQSLYVGQAGGFHCGEEGVATDEPEGEAAVLVASERLFEDRRVWDEVPRNHLLVVDHEGEVWTEPLGIE